MNVWASLKNWTRSYWRSSTDASSTTNATSPFLTLSPYSCLITAERLPNTPTTNFHTQHQIINFEENIFNSTRQRLQTAKMPREISDIKNVCSPLQCVFAQAINPSWKDLKLTIYSSSRFADARMHHVRVQHLPILSRVFDTGFLRLLEILGEGTREWGMLKDRDW
jgi:hypothetical protein